MELELLRYIQSAASPVLDVFFIGIIMLAEPALWVVVLAWIYWNSDKTAGRFISYAMFTSLCFGNGLKEIFRMPRPIGEPGIRTIYADTATGYSFPSGHSQMMATVGSAIPLWYRKNSLWYFFIPLMFLVAFSRMYLGVHYPRDVFVGLLLGVGISWLCAKLWDRALGHSGLFAATFGLMSIFLFVARSHDFLQLYGLFGGFAAGCAYEERYVRFGMRDRASRKAARFVLGLCVIGVVYGLGKLLPDLLWLIPIRYFFVAFAGYGLVPMLFKKLGI